MSAHVERRKELVRTLTRVALLEAREVAAQLAEAIAYLEDQKHLPAQETMRAMQEGFDLVGQALTEATRLTRRTM